MCAFVANMHAHFIIRAGTGTSPLLRAVPSGMAFEHKRLTLEEEILEIEYMRGYVRHSARNAIYWVMIILTGGVGITITITTSLLPSTTLN